MRQLRCLEFEIGKREAKLKYPAKVFFNAGFFVPGKCTRWAGSQCAEIFLRIKACEEEQGRIVKSM